MKIVTSGWYIFSSTSHINAFGYLYEDHFNPLEPTEKSLSENRAGCPNGQFRLVFHLQSDVTYVLVITTVYPENIGDFTITVSGLNNIVFKHISK